MSNLLKSVLVLMLLLCLCACAKTKTVSSSTATEQVDQQQFTVQDATNYKDIIVCENGVLKNTPERLYRKLLNTSYNTGTGRATKLVQEVLNKINGPDRQIKVDGSFGQLTKNAMCGISEQRILELYALKQADFYRQLAQRPGQSKFLKGWLNRAAYIPQFE